MPFAIGWNVAPEPRAIVRLTSRFRGAVLRELLRLKTGDASATWTRVGENIRAAVADMAGKEANDEPLKGHRHAEFLAWCESERPARLLVWRRSRAFDVDEQEAILLAAARDVSGAAAGADADEWKVRLVPLDRDVPPQGAVVGTARVIHNREGQSISVWCGKPSSEVSSTDNEHGAVVIKDQACAGPEERDSCKILTRYYCGGS